MKLKWKLLFFGVGLTIISMPVLAIIGLEPIAKILGILMSCVMLIAIFVVYKDDFIHDNKGGTRE